MERAANAAQVQARRCGVIQGTGGVSVFALQFAKMAGATVIGTSSSDAKLERAKTLGLDAGLNYRQISGMGKMGPAGDRQPRRRPDRRSGRSRHLRQSLQAVRMGGTVAQIGVLSQSDQPLPVAPLLHRQVRVHGVYVGSRAHFEAMNRAITANEYAAGSGPRSLPFARLARPSPPWKRGLILGKS